MSLEQNISCGCAEYEALERRQWLQTAWRMGALALSAPAWMPKLAFASGDPVPPGQRDLLVVVFLRGGADGLSLCVPFGDPFYSSSRGTLAVPPPNSSSPLRAIDLNGFFGLPPGLARLKPIYDAGHLALVHAVGNPAGVRSHFLDQDRMELATPNMTSSSGWLGRHLENIAGPADQLQGISTTHSIPRSMGGAPATVALPNGTNGLAGSSNSDADRRALLAAAYQGANLALGTNAGYILSALAALDAAGWTDRGSSSVVSRLPDPGNALNGAGLMSMAQLPATPTSPVSLRGTPMYPGDVWGRSFQVVAELAKLQIGLQAASIDLVGWDTHIGQGTTDGYLNMLLTNLATCIEAFYIDMEEFLGSVTLVVMSEFGRRVAPNSNGGFDHGKGGVMLVMGGNVNGNQVYSSWPGLHPDQLYDHLDLAITTDYRDVLAEILVKRTGSLSIPNIFPGFTPNFRGIVR
jgi:uncharacterized protein (DUF1501 family)